MTRTALYKGIYFAMLVGGGLVALGVLAYFRFSPLALLAIVIAFLIPGRILGYF